MSFVQTTLQTSQEIREYPAAREFRGAADLFCQLLQVDPIDKDEWGALIIRTLAELYAVAHRLPEVDIEATIHVPDTLDVNDDEWGAVYSLVTRVLGQQVYYWSYFDPTEPIDSADQRPQLGDLADDLSDIYRDVRPGLTAWDSGCDDLLPAIVFGWKHHNFVSHWGVHAVSALRALHPLIYLRGIQSS